MKTLSGVERDLQEAGFVHVTGLVRKNVLQSKVSYILPEKSDRGRWDEDQGSLILVTEEGRVWIGFVSVLNGILPVINRACPKGKGISIRCGDEIPTQLLLMRVRDPEDDMFGLYPPPP